MKRINFMKQVFLIGACLFLTSCFDRNLELTNHPPVVVDKKDGNGSVASPYVIKVFYGKDVHSYSVRKDDFEKLNVGDTLRNFRVY